jgi:two pore calcium channel protein
MMIIIIIIMNVLVCAGMVHTHGHNPKLVGSSYEDSHYEVFNFNDFASGMVLLFNLLLLNDWHSYMEGYVLLTGTRATRLFFLAFWVVATMYVLNIVVAFIIEAFMNQVRRSSYHYRTITS